jgi:hypothetical protein
MWIQTYAAVEAAVLMSGGAGDNISGVIELPLTTAESDVAWFGGCPAIPSARSPPKCWPLMVC